MALPFEDWSADLTQQIGSNIIVAPHGPGPLTPLMRSVLGPRPHALHGKHRVQVGWAGYALLIVAVRRPCKCHRSRVRVPRENLLISRML